MPMSTQSLRCCSNGSSMPEPDRHPAGLAGAAVGGLHRTGPAAGDDGEPGPGQRAAEGRPGRVLGVVARGAGRAEDADGARQLGQQPEALDELGLDAQDPPRIGVHPVRRAARVEQSLVGRAGADPAAAQGHRAALALAGPAERVRVRGRLGRVEPAAGRRRRRRPVSRRPQQRRGRRPASGHARRRRRSRPGQWSCPNGSAPARRPRPPSCSPVGPRDPA